MTAEVNSEKNALKKEIETTQRKRKQRLKAERTKYKWTRKRSNSTKVQCRNQKNAFGISNRLKLHENVPKQMKLRQIVFRKEIGAKRQTKRGKNWRKGCENKKYRYRHRHRHRHTRSTKQKCSNWVQNDANQGKKKEREKTEWIQEAGRASTDVKREVIFSKYASSRRFPRVSHQKAAETKRRDERRKKNDTNTHAHTHTNSHSQGA